MGQDKIALLADRGVVRVAGPDAESFLDTLVTNDITGMANGEARFAALLTPQGKILFEFFVVGTKDAYLLDVARNKVAELVKRLTLYRLRAKVEITDASGGAFQIMAYWERDPAELGPAPEGSPVYRDPRSAALGWRGAIRVPGVDLKSATVSFVEPLAPYHDYHAHRIALGIPEGGKDNTFGDAFPHEANMDRLNGVSFTKGCFVGQEVVARMQHKTVVRKRVARIEGSALTTGAEVLAGEAVIGAVGSVAGQQGLALLRLDRVVEALDKGQAITVAGQPVTVDADMLAFFKADSARKDEQKAMRI